jgi:putrescine aminotransferase
MREAVTYRKSSRHKALLDCSSGRGIYHLGRRPEYVAAALAEAAEETDQGNFPMISREKADLAAALAHFSPGELDCVVFGVMRGEPMEFAAKVARGRTNRMPLVTVAGSYFGETGIALSLSEVAGKEKYGPLLPGIRTVPFFDCRAIEQELAHGAAALIFEPIQVEHGGRMVLPADLRTARRLCNEHKALLVLDETRTGFGRTGFRFACEVADVVPDILLVGEALGAGVFPITAAIFTQNVNRFLNAHPMIHLSTFGGSDLGCRVGLAALKEYGRIEPWDNARERGAQLRLALEQGRLGGTSLVDIRGRGLLLALDFADAATANHYIKAAARQGVFLRSARFAPHVVLVEPPLIITQEETRSLGQCLLAALKG